MRGFLKVLNAVVTGLLVLLVIASAGLAITARRSRDAMPTILGRKVLTVLSGSMAPTIHTGDVIIVQPLAPDEAIQEGEIVTFRSREANSLLITHRVVGTVRVGGQPTAYVTRGDANDSPDTVPLLPEQVIGHYQWRLPYFGYVVTFLHKPLGIILAVVLPGVIVLGLEIRQLWRLLAQSEAAPSRGGDGPQA